MRLFSHVFDEAQQRRKWWFREVISSLRRSHLLASWCHWQVFSSFLISHHPHGRYLEYRFRIITMWIKRQDCDPRCACHFTPYEGKVRIKYNAWTVSTCSEPVSKNILLGDEAWPWGLRLVFHTIMNPEISFDVRGEGWNRLISHTKRQHMRRQWHNLR